MTHHPSSLSSSHVKSIKKRHYTVSQKDDTDQNRLMSVEVIVCYISVVFFETQCTDSFNYVEAVTSKNHKSKTLLAGRA